MLRPVKWIPPIAEFTIRLSTAVFLVGLFGCTGEIIEEGYYNPDTPTAKAWRDEHTGDDENLGPNAPGYLGPDEEFSMSPDDDPH